jgi:glycosyltransferase involved in cell wall biosynthesis
MSATVDARADLGPAAAAVTRQSRNLPRISIITPCLNGERYIAEAIESVLRQSYPNFEHVVVDGASTDGTVALLAQYAHLTIVSEPDRGSHEAMNKGVSRATGDVIGFLNVDDSYPDNTLRKVGAAFADNPGVDVLVGDTIVYEDAGPGNRRIIRFLFDHPNGIWLTECLFGNPGINGCFFRRSVFENVGLFNNDFYICADRDFLTRAALSEVTSASLNIPTLWYRAHSNSQTINRMRSNILSISTELFRMASHFLETNKPAGINARLARAWYAFEGARLAFVQFRCGQLYEAAKLIVLCSLQNPLWPLHLVRAIFLRHTVRQYYHGGWNADLPARQARRWPEDLTKGSDKTGHDSVQ